MINMCFTAVHDGILNTHTHTHTHIYTNFTFSSYLYYFQQDIRIY
jgi:hypothetical protein